MQNVRPWPKASVEKPWLDSASVFCYPWRRKTTSLKNCTAVMPALWCPAVPSNNAIAYSQAPPFSLDVRQIRYKKTTKLPNLKIGFRQCILSSYAHYNIKVWGQWIWLLGKQHIPGGTGRAIALEYFAINNFKKDILRRKWTWELSCIGSASTTRPINANRNSQTESGPLKSGVLSYRF